jgi:transmembrane sensor
VAPDPKNERLAEVLSRVDPRWDAAQTERALGATHRRRTRRRAASLAAAVVLLSSAGAAGAWLAQGSAPIASAPAAPPAPEAPEPDRVVRLADGSRVSPEGDAEVIVEHVTDELVAVRVDRGAADVEVVPGRPRRFEVTVGEVTVTVLGTRFRVERLEAGRAHVEVERGHVGVAWAAGHADLFAGDEGTFPRRGEPDGPVAAAEPSPASRPARARATADDRAAEPTGWRELASASRYDEAYAALGTRGEGAAAVRDAVEDLLLAADVARLSGHPVEALPWLERVERDHASDPRAALAAFTRGRILMDLGRPGEAAVQLERVLAMEPSGSLAEDALARAALAHAGAGASDRAAELAGEYLSAHPTGRWASRLRPIVARSTASQ